MSLVRELKDTPLRNTSSICSSYSQLDLLLGMDTKYVSRYSGRLHPIGSVRDLALETFRSELGEVSAHHLLLGADHMVATVFRL